MWIVEKNLPGLVSLHGDAMSDDNDDDKVDTLDVILGHVSQREDAGYDDVGEDVGVGVGVSAVVGVGVNGQGVSLGASENYTCIHMTLDRT